MTAPLALKQGAEGEQCQVCSHGFPKEIRLETPYFCRQHKELVPRTGTCCLFRRVTLEECEEWADRLLGRAKSD